MHVTLEVIAGPEVGRSIRLAASQLLQIGRTDWSDIALSGDDDLSPVHFAVETDGRHCHIRDLGSEQGTQVNGKGILEQVLADGDKISAGQSIFLVRIEGGADASEVEAARATLPPSAVPPPKPKSTVKYTKESCATGLYLYRGSIEQIPPADLAELLSAEVPLYVLADFKKLDQGTPAAIEQPQYLFDWLEPATAKLVSPVMVSQSDYPASVAILESGWGADAVVCLFSKIEPAQLLAHLRGEVRGGGDSVVGYCWPCVLAPMLSYYRPESIQKLMEGIEAILVEFPDLPDTWQLFAPKELDETLQKLGFIQEEPQPAETADENNQ